MTPVLPIIHMNGTAREELLALRQNAAHAIGQAQEALALMGPNARDYYVEPGRLEKAIAQHSRRVQALRDLYDEIVAEYQAIED